MIRFVCYWDKRLTNFNWGDDEWNGQWPTGADNKLVVIDRPETEDDIVSKMQSALARKDRKGYILGEFMPDFPWSIKKPQRKKYLAFLAALSRVNTDKVKAFWHSTLITPWFARQYATVPVDYIFIESYWPWKLRPLLWIFFKINYNMARKYGFENKLVYGLGVNQGQGDFVHGPDAWAKYVTWCNDEKTMRAQLGYIKTHCPGISGIAFYNPAVQDWYWDVMNAVVIEYFA